MGTQRRIGEQLEFFMRQGQALDDVCWNYHKGNPESEEANQSIHEFKGRDRRRIIEHLAGRGELGDTCDRMEEFLSLRHQTCSARCSELLRDRVIIRKPIPGQPGKYFRRPTRTGKNAAVLILVGVIGS